MLQVVNEIKANKITIEDEYRERSNRTVSLIAEKYGYTCEGLGIGEVLKTADLDVVFFGRKDPDYNDELMENAITRARSEGYEIRNGMYINLPNGFNVVTKRHEARGRVSFMERRPDYGEPVFVMGCHNNQTIIGLVVDAGPEHTGIIQDMAHDIHMEPRTAGKAVDKNEKEKFENLLGDLRIDI